MGSVGGVRFLLRISFRVCVVWVVCPFCVGVTRPTAWVGFVRGRP